MFMEWLAALPFNGVVLTESAIAEGLAEALVVRINSKQKKKKTKFVKEKIESVPVLILCPSVPLSSNH